MERSLKMMKEKNVAKDRMHVLDSLPVNKAI